MNEMDHTKAHGAEKSENDLPSDDNQGKVEAPTTDKNLLQIGKGKSQQNELANLTFGSFAAFYPRPGPRSKMTGEHFGGISRLANGHIAKTYIMTETATLINTHDELPPDFARSCPGGAAQACSDITARFSAMTGRIYITVCRCDDPSLRHKNANLLGTNHEEIFLSGFWVGSRFITSAHFLDIVEGTDEQNKNTVELLQEKAFATAGFTKSVVSSNTMVPATKDINGVAVYLEKLDKKADLAVFVRYDINGVDTNKFIGIQKTDIVNLNSIDRSQGIFTIGYYSDDSNIGKLNAYDQEIANRFWISRGDAEPRTYFPIKYTGVMQDRNDQITFEQVFQFPHLRTISMGHLDKPLHENGHSTTMSCDLTAWFGGSGGLVGGFTRKEVNGKSQLLPVIFGLMKGDGGPKTTIVALTESGKDWLLD